MRKNYIVKIVILSASISLAGCADESMYYHHDYPVHDPVYVQHYHHHHYDPGPRYYPHTNSYPNTGGFYGGNARRVQVSPPPAVPAPSRGGFNGGSAHPVRLPPQPVQERESVSDDTRGGFGGGHSAVVNNFSGR